MTFDPINKPLRFNLKRLTAIAVMTAVCFGASFSTAYAQGNGNGQGVPLVLETLDTFQQRIDAINANLQGILNTQTTTLDTAISNSTSTVLAANANLNELIVGTHLVNPFDVVVDVCAEIGAGAEYGAELGLGVEGELPIKGGIDFFGTGATLGFSAGGNVAGAANIGADVGVTYTACINGIFARQPGTFQEDVSSSLSDPDQIAFIENLLMTGQDFQDRVIDTATGANLYSTNTDKLNVSLDAFELVTFADDPDFQDLITGGLFGASSPAGALINGLPLPAGLTSVFGTTGLFSTGFVTSLDLTTGNICTLAGNVINLSGPLQDACNAITDIEDFINSVQSITGLVDTICEIVDC